MNHLQQQLFNKARTNADAGLLEFDRAFDLISQNSENLTPGVVRDIARPFQAMLATLTVLECSLRGNVPKTGENKDPLPMGDKV
ncbi:MAG TPA: hypothetical protein VN516_09400 [Candidatus Baltobacteraceae bacterium]|nr:hypothetical protein [Candidatus Baltobacteraceae bacterium]